MVAAFSAIVAMFSLLATPRVDPDRIRYMIAQIHISSIAEALDAYKRDCGFHPPEAGAFAELLRSRDCRTWKGPYLRRDVPLDPWGTPY
jgi:general secretion pathway protein G